MENYWFNKDDQYILNHCTKYLARTNHDARHSYGTDRPASVANTICEAWRFPVIDTYGGGATAITDGAEFRNFNEVTFIYRGSDAKSPSSVAVIGSFATLHEPIPLRQVMFEDEPTRYWSLTYVVRKGAKHIYRFMVDQAYPINDPINPQEDIQDNGQTWSRFFTDAFSSPVVMERWELDLLYRLSAEILPFQTGDASNFLARFYDYLDRANRDEIYANVYRMDASLGEVNFIDNILAREERQHLQDYKVCLRILDRVLRQRNPYIEPAQMPRDIYFDLYNEMATDKVAGWDYDSYGSPRYFLYLLRRHVVTGAFSHPKYGGNTAAAGWKYLEERYCNQPLGPGKPGTTLFDWQCSLEPPVGKNPDYLG